jgi:hypothetical protein
VNVVPTVVQKRLPELSAQLRSVWDTENGGCRQGMLEALKWRAMRWHDKVVIEPGRVSAGRGSALIAAGKNTSTLTDPADPNPVLVVEIDEPVCAAFDRAATEPHPVLGALLRAAGWL